MRWKQIAYLCQGLKGKSSKLQSSELELSLSQKINHLSLGVGMSMDLWLPNYPKVKNPKNLRLWTPSFRPKIWTCDWVNMKEINMEINIKKENYLQSCGGGKGREGSAVEE